MSKFDYGRLQNTADRLLTRFNESPIQVERDSGSYVDGEFVDGATGAFEAVGVVVPYVQRLVNNTTILAGDLQATFKRDFTPEASDVFIIDGGRYKVISIENLKPSDSILAYRVQLRK